MKFQETHIFRAALLIGYFTYLAYWLLPYSYGYLDSDVGTLLSYAGYSGIYEGNGAVSAFFLVAWTASAVGIFFYKKYARVVFLALVIIASMMTPLYGISVETGLGSMLLGVSHIADGFVIGLAYFSSSVRSRFCL